MGDTLEQNPNINIIPVDVYGLVNNIIASPGDFDLTNVTDNFLESGAADASQYLFWDILHPTAVGHQEVAQGAISSITRIPEVVDILQTSPGF
jgi:outer membrane lipase/esterase